MMTTKRKKTEMEENENLFDSGLLFTNPNLISDEDEFIVVIPSVFFGIDAGFEVAR
jgi:hypothetical protein